MWLYVYMCVCHSDCVHTLRSYVSRQTESTAGGSRFPRLPGNRSNHAHRTARPHFFFEKIPSQNQKALVPTHPYLFPSVWARLRTESPGGSFPAPDRFFFLLSSPPAPLERFPPQGKGPQTRARGKTWGGAWRGVVRQGPSGRKSAASGAADWLSGWRLSLPSLQFRAGWRGIERLPDHGARARRRL